MFNADYFVDKIATISCLDTCFSLCEVPKFIRSKKLVYFQVHLVTGVVGTGTLGNLAAWIYS